VDRAGLSSDAGTPRRETPLAPWVAGPEVLRPSPAADALRAAFTINRTPALRQHDHPSSACASTCWRASPTCRVSRSDHARWDFSAVLVCEARTGAALGTLYPLNRIRNADAVRRPRTPSLTAPPAAGVEPLLDSFLRQYPTSGLPPAYRPKDDTPKE
jgi:hypothetical protein